MKKNPIVVLLPLFLFFAFNIHADLYRVYKDAPNDATGNPDEWGFEDLYDAWEHATTTNTGSHTIQIEWNGPTGYFEAPEMALEDTGDIHIQAYTGVRPEIRPDGDHAVFANNSTTGKILTISGYDEGIYNRIVLSSDYASPLLTTSATGNGVCIIEKVNFMKKERKYGDPEVPGAPNGNYVVFTTVR